MIKSKAFCITALLTVFGYASSYSIPFRRPCHDMSPECLKNSLQAAISFFAKGDPDLGLESLDPYILGHLNLSLSGISIEFSDGYAKGLKTCIVDFARLDGDTFESQIHCNLIIRGKYRSFGSLLMFPIDGNGMSTIKCNNIKIHSILKLETKVKDGKEYINIKSFDIKHAYDGRVSYAMTNLFRGNAEINKAILEFMNNNWRMVAEEFGTPIVDYGVKSIMKNVRRFFDEVYRYFIEKPPDNFFNSSTETS